MCVYVYTTHSCGHIRLRIKYYTDRRGRILCDKECTETTSNVRYEQSREMCSDCFRYYFGNGNGGNNGSGGGNHSRPSQGHAGNNDASNAATKNNNTGSTTTTANNNNNHSRSDKASVGKGHEKHR